jgi:hypothetical protein
MGRGVLPPPATFDGRVMLAATLVHFALSIGYGLILSPLIARRRMPASILAGVVFGLCLYLVNMYGFAVVFPWFRDSRDGIAVVAHATSGLVAAGAYRVISRRRSAHAYACATLRTGRLSMALTGNDMNGDR